MVPMVPLPVPPGVGPWVSWIFIAIAIGAFAVILIGGIQRYRRMKDEPDDPNAPRNEPDGKPEDR